MGARTTKEKNLDKGKLEEFDAKLPSWMRKAVRDDFFSMSSEELRAFGDYQAEHGVSHALNQLVHLNREYQRLARRVPAEWNRYCEIEQQNYLHGANVPEPGNIGRPRKHLLAAEARLLKAEGKSYSQIAIVLNAKYGPSTTSREAVRKLLSRQKNGPATDETHS